jgi:hypothetical protein
VRVPQLRCLDGVLARFDVIRQSVMLGQLTIDAEDVYRDLVDPEVCEATPRLPLTFAPIAANAFAVLQSSVHDHRETGEEGAILKAAPGDPCVAMIVELARAARGRSESAAAAAGAAERCGDDRTLVEALIAGAWADIEGGNVNSAKFAEAMHRLDSLLPRVRQPDVEAKVAHLRAHEARQRLAWAEVEQFAEAAIVGFGYREPHEQLAAAVEKLEALLYHHHLDRVIAEAPRWRTLARALGERRNELAIVKDVQLAHWNAGDIAGAHRESLAWQPLSPRVSTRAISGIVVDARGAPVAWASLVAGYVIADAVELGVPFLAVSPRMSFAGTDEQGKFTIAVPTGGVVVAGRGNERSLPVSIDSAQRLVLAPTTSIRGHIALDASSDATVAIGMSIDATVPYTILAPVRPDGSFELVGVPIGKLHIGPVIVRGPSSISESYIEIEVGAAGREDVTLELPHGRPLTVVVRSELMIPLERAIVLVLAGGRVPATLADLTGTNQLAREVGIPVTGDPPADLGKIARRGDAIARFGMVVDSATMICAVGTSWTLRVDERNAHEIPVRCKPVPRDVGVLVIEVPPIKRFD